MSAYILTRVLSWDGRVFPWIPPSLACSSIRNNAVRSAAAGGACLGQQLSRPSVRSGLVDVQGVARRKYASAAGWSVREEGRRSGGERERYAGLRVAVASTPGPAGLVTSTVVCRRLDTACLGGGIQPAVKNWCVASALMRLVGQCEERRRRKKRWRRNKMRGGQ